MGASEFVISLLYFGFSEFATLSYASVAVKTLNRKQFEDLIQGSEVLAEDTHGLKVLALPSGEYLKLFRRKRLVSSAALWPYARRFEHASGQLKARAIPTVEVIDVFKVRGPRRDAVRYQPLGGRTFREALSDADGIYDLMNGFARFFAELHVAGVYFRAIHAANIIVMQDDRMGLIDISEATFRNRALGVGQRARNFKHLVRYEEDAERLVEFGISSFFRHYLVHAGLSGVDGARLARCVARLGAPFDALR